MSNKSAPKNKAFIKLLYSISLERAQELFQGIQSSIFTVTYLHVFHACAYIHINSTFIFD